MATNVFLSCGGVSTEAQERFVSAVERQFEASGLRPLTIGRNVFDHGQPLKLVDKVMRGCAGAAILAYERLHIADGKDRRGSPRERAVRDQATATPWNQIEAALAYSLRLPLLVIVENGLRQEGLLESGYDWRVVTLNIAEPPAQDPAFVPVFKSWRKEVRRAAWRKGLRTQFRIGERIDKKDVAAVSAAGAVRSSS
ncbi:MAG: hypothetical protein H7124_16325 [Phycisphaerales bacterium]|nr:hypothetical protein [Hyphomonadaceae bacterium]